VSIEANSGICRGMLRHRYNNTKGQGETVPPEDPDSPLLTSAVHNDEQVEEDP
jgi:hypothetical protein